VATTPDGSPVEMYLHLPGAKAEAELIHGAIPEGAEILELGSGVGRVTHELVALGHPVVAVDESEEMLAHVRGAETVCSRIEELDLNRRFACVLMMSHLVNTEASQRSALLAAAARHVAVDGVVLIERYDPAWQPEESDPKQHGDVLISLTDVRAGDGHFSATARYQLGDKVWLQPFTAWILDDTQLGKSLAAAGLEIARPLDGSGRWVAARPILPP
jgi:SAM-dependent methyltransferase